MLRQVTIKAVRDHRRDSLNNRREFSSVFNYRGPTFKDLLISKVSYVDKPVPMNHARNSSAQILNLDVLSVLGLAGKSKSSVIKLQKIMLRDEEAKFADHLFSKERVEALTKLSGDSLTRFMTIYRPPVEVLRKMSSYEIMDYIKRKLGEFTDVSR